MRAVIAYGVSLLVHVGVITWLGIATLNPPRPWQLRPGRASIELVGSLVGKTPGRHEAPIRISPAAGQLPAAVTAGSEPNTRAETIPNYVTADLAREIDQPMPAPLVRLPERKAMPQQPRALLENASLNNLPLARSMLEPAGGESASSRAASGTQVDAPPTQVITNPQPPYPAADLAAGHEGRVVLRVKIDASGFVRHVTVARSSGYKALDESAQGTVGQWRFEPAQQGGMPAEWEGLIPIRFRISGGE